jgi:ABC-2 type transport system ATP-binding protein
MTTVTISHVSKAFGKVQAVDDVSFEVHPGEIFGLLGPNGAGKTTTIRMMLDIFRPDRGQVTIFGGGLDEAKKNRIGYLPEERGLYKDLKLEQTLIFLATLKGLDEATARQRLGDWLRRLDLYEHRQKKIQELSRGMQQKAQIIATLLHEPELIVVDEPFSGLDPVNTRLVKEIMEEQRQSGWTIIMSTHQMYQVEALCNRIVLINEGRTVLYGEVEQIKRDFAGNAVVVEGQGDFTNLPGVLETRQQNGDWHMALLPGTSPQDVFRALAARDGIKIERFEIAEPSLDDIFISVVQGEKRGTSNAKVLAGGQTRIS